METLNGLLSWRYVPAAIALYFASLAFYRLFLHPLARFPGPKLAAITRYYEAYYDIVQNGQYVFRVQDMHKKYGPIVRISPYELHVIDPAFFEKLYRQDGRWNKYDWAYDAFSAPGSTICAADHDVHKARRLPLNPFFSKAKVSSRQVLILQNVDRLCGRISDFAVSKTALSLGAAISAFTRDVATEFILGKSYNSLGQEDFNAAMTTVFQNSGHIWRITKHVRWFGPTMMSIPRAFIIKTADEGTRGFFRYLNTLEIFLASATFSSSTDDHSPPNVVHEIVKSDLPPADKSFERVRDDIGTITGASFETTASVLRLIFFHVFSNAEILKRLRAELASAAAQSSGSLDLKMLEQLPYLTSILMEGMRHSPALATRLARIAPDRDLAYGQWRIPAGTPVGMTTLLMHMDETLYPDPKSFNPDRWMDLEVRKKAQKTYAPFSKGTRICLGMYLAWAEMYLVVAALVQRFNFEFEDVTAEDFECVSDQFVIGTRGQSILRALVTAYQG
ncbi:Cytochrome P450 [Mycena venus]|uniref:Cytochrome P450 n=1 Tax=Mycena venus TaxID=2733690 RepID=A0A8H7CGM2_9AGAR|nr:Cytochrome P450 [Mycena venus]